MPDRLLDSQFISPDRNNRERLRQMGYAFVDLITDAVLDGQDQSFVQDHSPMDLQISSQGIDWSDLLLEVRSQVLPRSLNLHSPRYMGHMDSVPLAITIWADALVAALNNNMLSRELAPLFTQLEVQLMQWFAQLFGLGDRSFGTMTAGGSLANITALVLARNAKQHQIKSQGVQQKLVAFVSDAAHNSFDKAMNVIGLGCENLVRVKTNQRGEIELDALETEIQNAIALGGIPFFLAAIVGTTVTGAIDDITGVSQLARKYECWFHVDAAYGGAAIFSPQWKYLLTGSHLADSMTFNPQKWMWVSRTCAMLLVKDKQHLVDGFDQLQLPYMSDNSLNYGNLTLQGTRRTDSLKLWLAMRSLGLNGYAELINHSMNQAKSCRDWVDNSPELELVCEPTLNIVCLRSINPEIDNVTLQRNWIAEGKMWLSLPLWKGDRILKAVILHPHAEW